MVRHHAVVELLVGVGGAAVEARCVEAVVARHGYLQAPRIGEGAALHLADPTPHGAGGEPVLLRAEIGRASCRERVWKYGSVSVVAVSFQTNKKQYTR